MESDIQVLLIRCLQSELYAAIVALSIILGGPSWGTPFDAPYGGTCPLGEKLCGIGHEVRPRWLAPELVPLGRLSATEAGV